MIDHAPKCGIAVVSEAHGQRPISGYTQANPDSLVAVIDPASRAVWAVIPHRRLLGSSDGAVDNPEMF